MRLDDVRGFVFDIDGTLVHRAGDELHVQPGASEVLARVRASGRPFVIYTNGSHETPETFAAGLRAVGLSVDDDELLTPLRSVQLYLRAHRREGTVFLFGNAPARDYLRRAGVPLVDGEDAIRAEFVFVATPDAFEFAKLERAAFAIRAGALLLAGSYAPAYAGASGPILSRGAMVAAALAKVGGKRPIVVGKPSRAALQTITERVGVSAHELAVIGDDVTMDVALGHLGGSRTILVRSGTSGRIRLADVPERHRPDAVVDGVGQLLEWL